MHFELVLQLVQPRYLFRHGHWLQPAKIRILKMCASCSWLQHGLKSSLSLRFLSTDPNSRGQEVFESSQLQQLHGGAESQKFVCAKVLNILLSAAAAGRELD